MTNQKANLILHPVRLRIVTELTRQQLTPRQLAQLMPSIAQATLYRHLTILLKGGILEIVAQNQVNGAIERTYTLAQGQGRLTTAELTNLTPEEHLYYFTMFATALIDSFAEYVQEADREHLVEDGLSYQRAVVYLSEGEREQFQREITELTERIMAYPHVAHRHRFTLASVVIPDRNTAKRNKNELTD